MTARGELNEDSGVLGLFPKTHIYQWRIFRCCLSGCNYEKAI